ncbi:tetratricopeptide repeat protein [Phenylobacterium sp.]|uniref:tetratricopeptide repeat protein n=1 Tax=Phenylobacterium sp. TaxID=1871053 RepID=UPI001210049B|nr:tetratricopeptide repeat protein [Phenylobacterium sp.]THD70183.1 MAG: tetratricopeptide repeat protein [Phenylobacterium sp.]
MTDIASSQADAAGLMREALAHHAASLLAEAEAAYRAILERWPDHAEAMGMLAMILADGPNAAEAEAMVLRRLELRPEDPAALLGVGWLKARQGDNEAALEIFQRAAQWRPDLAPIHNEIGVALHQLGRREEALTALGHALAVDPAFRVAHGNRGLVLIDCGRFDEALDDLIAAIPAPSEPQVNVGSSVLGAISKAAVKTGRLAEAEAALRARVAAGHADIDTLEQLAVVLDRAKRTQDALDIRNGLARNAGVRRRPGPNGRETVLLLAAVGSGHLPTRYLVDPEAFSIASMNLLSPEQPDSPLGQMTMEDLAAVGADVIISTLGDIHRDAGQLASASALCAALGKPVINPPEGILKTGRDTAAILFGNVPDTVVPRVRPLGPVELGRLAIEAPMLVRPAGDHGGENLIKLEGETDKAAYLAADPEERLLICPFHDFRSADGLWRKYRLIFVDRRAYPFHLAIGDHWLLHYWRAEMARSAWKLAEEERFMDDWRGVFGPRAAAAVDEVARRLDLDYGGIDCALTADGRLLLFEANATFLLHLDEPADLFPAKHRNVPLIREAFTRMVRERIRS